MESFDYFKVCKDCTIFCCQQFYAFLAEHEIEQIQSKLNIITPELKDIKKEFFESKKIDGEKESMNARILKKIDGKCIFLKDDKICLIHDVKPFDCKIWPLTFDYFPEKNKLVIYLGSCPLTNELPNSWIESTIQQIKKELKKWNKKELTSYSLLCDIENYKTLLEISNFFIKVNKRSGRFKSLKNKK